MKTKTTFQNLNSKVIGCKNNRSHKVLTMEMKHSVTTIKLNVPSLAKIEGRGALHIWRKSI